jgi:anthranilate synthase component 1
MLLDLGRNDVGRVAQIGSVRVADRMVIERYSHVMHIVSNVEGTLRPGLTSVDVLRAAFPAGTVSGRPRCARWRSSTSSSRPKRGIYSGAAGYLSFQDDMDTAIVLRTAVLKNGVLYAQAGGGIVHDSSAEGEWQETLNKLRAVLRAAEMVQQGLDDE